MLLGHSSTETATMYLQFNDYGIKELYERTPF